MRGGNGIHKRTFLTSAVAFVVGEEEELVRNHLAAEAGTELILTEGRLLGEEEVAGIGSIVPQEVVGAAVPFVGAGFGNDVYGCTRVAALVSREHIRLNLKLADRFHGWAENDGEREALIVVDAVKQEVVGTFAIAVGEDFAAGTEVVGAGTTHDGAFRSEADAGDAGSKGGELDEVATVEREVSYRAGLDHLADGGGVFFEEGSGRGDLNSFGNLADFQLQINTGGLVHFEAYVVLDGGFETRLLGAEFVAPGLEEGKIIKAAGICNNFAGDQRFHVLRGDFSRANSGSGFIGNRTGDSSEILGEG